MLNENIKTIRKSKGLSQEELASKINVVRQTVSKWEQGLSVPDSDMLISLSNALNTPVSVLLGESIKWYTNEQTNGQDEEETNGINNSNDMSCAKEENNNIKELAEKLEVINAQFAHKKKLRRRILKGVLIGVGAIIIISFIVLAKLGSPYLGWDYSNPETAVLGVVMHYAEWLFVRIAPIILVFVVAGLALIHRCKQ